MVKLTDTKNATMDKTPEEETEQIDQFIKKMKLQNRILKKLKENLEVESTQSDKKT